jgi:cell wall-associated NlpC family hydrolase
VVGVPVAHLRAQPHTSPQPGTHDELQETQLLYGERVQVMKEETGWAKVRAVEQAEYTHNKRWEGYPGWVEASVLRKLDDWYVQNIVVTDKWADAWNDAYRKQPAEWKFPFGTRLRGIDMGGVIWRVELLDGSTVWLAAQSAQPIEYVSAMDPAKRRQLALQYASLFIGDPYYWGGRSPASNTHETALGVDCSALTNLVMRAVGVDIPRDAHEQYMRSTPITSLRPADLIFLSEAGKPDAVVHVMLYAGNGEIIEAPGTGLLVRKLPLTERLKQPAESLAPGAVVDGQTVYFGSYLP